MRIVRDDYEFDVDVQKTAAYYDTHSLCGCSACKNFYARVKDAFPRLASFLADFGVKADKPDEAGWIDEGDEIGYDASYTVAGTITRTGNYEIGMRDGGVLLSIVISRSYVPNEQTSDFFVITVFGIRLPKAGDHAHASEVVI